MQHEGSARPSVERSVISREEHARKRRKQQVELAERGIDLAEGSIDWGRLNDTSVLMGIKTINDL